MREHLFVWVLFVKLFVRLGNTLIGSSFSVFRSASLSTYILFYLPGVSTPAMVF